jgi:hypothetical protein
MSPRNELRLPPAPPLPHEVRERVLRTVLDERDDRGTTTATLWGRRARRWAPLLTAAAVVLVAVVVAMTLRGAPPPAAGPAAPVTGPTVTLTDDRPLSADELPAPTGDEERDAALVRCATAVARSDRAADYPPTSAWRSSELYAWGIFMDGLLVIDDAFGCMLTPTSVIVTATTGPSVGGVQVLGLTDRNVALLNPQQRRYTIGPPGLTIADNGAAVMFYPPIPETPLDGVRITVEGDDGYDGPLPQPAPPLTVVDRPLPTRPDTPEGAELGDCLERNFPGVVEHLELWVPVGRHDVGVTAPPALVARMGDLYAGVCVPDPPRDPFFASGVLPAPGDRPQVVVRYHAGSEGVLLTVPADVTRVEIALVTGPSSDPTACTIVDGLAACTIDGDPELGQDAPEVSVTAFTAADPQGVEVFRG